MVLLQPQDNYKLGTSRSSEIFSSNLASVREVARLHHKISNSRKNFHFQTSHTLCDMADMIFVEDIDFCRSAKGFLGKYMLDGGFGEFRQLLSWVCWKRGKYFAQVDHKYTSQICPNCNTHTGKKELSQRLHICPVCNYQTTRDHASAEVILNRGLESIVRLDESERKLSGNGVLSGVYCLDKCRSRNTDLRGLEARTLSLG
ncbi:MAG: RNA-guided endonuclease InsQ/TnpB family protein [Xenococcaceae cyanobacterium]